MHDIICDVIGCLIEMLIVAMLRSFASIISKWLIGGDSKIRLSLLFSYIVKNDRGG